MPVDTKPHQPEPNWVNVEILSALSRIVSVLQSIHQQQLASAGSGSRDRAVTKCDLEQTERTIMSAISDFAAKQKAFNDRQDTAVSGLTADVEALNKKIEELQNSPGAITPEDQALLNDLETRGDAITAKLEALDALTPPVPPTA